MKMSRILIIGIAVAIVVGCFRITDHGIYGDDDYSESRTNAPISFLCVGMERSKRFGSCPGCAIDASGMFGLLTGDLGYNGQLLISEQATKEAVVKCLYDGISRTPADGIFIFCYSGHGGQEYLGGEEPDGSDEPDEYLCLYDTYMLDDEIWDIAKRCKGRVMMYFDACHSATMYRSVASELKVGKEEFAKNAVSFRIEPDGSLAMAMEANDLVKSKGFKFSPQKFTAASAMSEKSPAASLSMLCWSGCEEMEYSYGGPYGGVMTSALLSGWKKGISYADLWDIVRGDVMAAQPTQHPVFTVMGGFDMNKEAFK